MQFGGIIYLRDLSKLQDVSRGKNVMTPMKLSYPEIAPRVILATVDGENSMARRREDHLKDTTWQEVQIRQFTNTKDFAWSIVDTILGISPIKLCYIQDELDKICDSLPKHFPEPKEILGFFPEIRNALNDSLLTRRVPIQGETPPSRVGGASEPWMKHSAGLGLPFSTSSQIMMTCTKNEIVMILYAFPCFLIAIGTDSWYQNNGKDRSREK